MTLLPTWEEIAASGKIVEPERGLLSLDGFYTPGYQEPSMSDQATLFPLDQQVVPKNIAPGFRRGDIACIEGVSVPLQFAKASEHLVCAELILQGWNAFLADAGLPYDIVVDLGDGKFFRIQVKATCKLWTPKGYRRSSQRAAVYRFALRRNSRGPHQRLSLKFTEGVALVALDTRLVAFLSVASIIKADGTAVGCLELKSRRVKYQKGKAGKDPNLCGRFLEDFQVFDPSRKECVLDRSKHKRLTRADMLEIKRLSEAGLTREDIGRQFGVSAHHILWVIRKVLRPDGEAQRRIDADQAICPGVKP